MTVRYFRVANESGAYIDNMFYSIDDIVPLDIPQGKKAPMWGVEVDAHGDDIGVAPAANAVQEKLMDALANKIAGSETKTTPIVVSLNEAQKGQVKEALALLDNDNKEHWTTRGLPNTETVSGLVGFAVERKDINEIAPEFVRKDTKAAE